MSAKNPPPPTHAKEVASTAASSTTASSPPVSFAAGHRIWGADPLGASEEESERWPGARGKVHDVVKESRAMRGVHEDLDREREKDAEIERLRSSRSSERVPGGGKGVAGVHKGRATLDVRGVGSDPVEEEETSLFLTDEWMQELQSVGKGDSGATTAHLMGQRTARLHRSTESSLWHRSAADTAAPSLSSRA